VEIIMTKKIIQQNEEWGNIELPGLPDEILLTKDWTKSRKSNNGMLKEGVKEKHQSKIENRNSEWLKNVSEANRKKSKDPIFRSKSIQALQKRSKTQDWIEKQKINARKRRKPVVTPDGIFDSRFEAANYYKCANSWISVLIKKYPTEYYHISIEEYDRLKK